MQTCLLSDASNKQTPKVKVVQTTKKHKVVPILRVHTCVARARAENETNKQGVHWTAF